MEKQVITSLKKNSLNESERLSIATLLIKAGYTVRIVSVKEGSTASYNIEYWGDKP